MGNVGILVADNSGSMGKRKKNVGVAYFNKVVGIEAEKHYIGFGKTGVEFKSEDEFLELETQGGTYVSSGLELALDIITDLSVRDIRASKVVIATDGDNWAEDNDYTISLIKQLTSLGVEVDYVEIKMGTYMSTLLCKITEALLVNAENKKLKLVQIPFKLE